MDSGCGGGSPAPGAMPPRAQRLASEDVFFCGSVTETGFHGFLLCIRVNCSALSGCWECAGKVASALIWRVCRWPYVLKGARWCEMKRRAGSNRKLGAVVASRTLTEEGHPGNR